MHDGMPENSDGNLITFVHVLIKCEKNISLTIARSISSNVGSVTVSGDHAPHPARDKHTTPPSKPILPHVFFVSEPIAKGRLQSHLRRRAHACPPLRYIIPLYTLSRIPAYFSMWAHNLNLLFPRLLFLTQVCLRFFYACHLSFVCALPFFSAMIFLLTLKLFSFYIPLSYHCFCGGNYMFFFYRRSGRVFSELIRW